MPGIELRSSCWCSKHFLQALLSSLKQTVLRRTGIWGSLDLQTKQEGVVHTKRMGGMVKKQRGRGRLYVALVGVRPASLAHGWRWNRWHF